MCRSCSSGTARAFCISCGCAGSNAPVRISPIPPTRICRYRTSASAGASTTPHISAAPSTMPSASPPAISVVRRWRRWPTASCSTPIAAGRSHPTFSSARKHWRTTRPPRRPQTCTSGAPATPWTPPPVRTALHDRAITISRPPSRPSIGAISAATFHPCSRSTAATSSPSKRCRSTHATTTSGWSAAIPAPKRYSTGHPSERRSTAAAPVRWMRRCAGGALAKASACTSAPGRLRCAGPVRTTSSNCKSSTSRRA